MTKPSLLNPLMLFSLATMLTACATPQEAARNQGMSAFHSGNHSLAVSILRPLKHDRPDDEELARILDRASHTAMNEALTRAAGFREKLEPVESFSAYQSALEFLPLNTATQPELAEKLQAETRAQTEYVKGLSAWKIHEIEAMLAPELPRLPAPDRELWTGTFNQGRSRGSEECVQIAARVESKHLALADLVERICSRFGPASARIREAALKHRESQYRTVHLHLEVPGIPTETALSIGELLNKRLATSPGFDLKGSALLRVDVSGKFTDATVRTVVPLTHAYAGMRGETLEYAHSGQRTELSYTLALKTRHKYGEDTIEEALTESFKRTDVEHFDDIPAIQLKPHVIDWPRPESWAALHAKRFADRVADAWSASWKMRHCKEPSHKPTLDNWSVLGEHAAMCLRVAKEAPPSWVITWWSQIFGEVKLTN